MIRRLWQRLTTRARRGYHYTLCAGSLQRWRAADGSRWFLCSRCRYQVLQLNRSVK